MQELIDDIARLHEADDNNQKLLSSSLTDQLEKMKLDVQAQRPIIEENVVATAEADEQAFVLRYSDVKDPEQVRMNVQELFGESPVSEFLVDSAVKVFNAITSTTELKEMQGWRRTSKIKNVDGNIFGIEVHFVVNGMKQAKGRDWKFNKVEDTILLIGYKYVVYSMSLNPDEIPKENELLEETALLNFRSCSVKGFDNHEMIVVYTYIIIITVM